MFSSQPPAAFRKFFQKNPQLAPTPESLAARLIASSMALVLTIAGFIIVYLTPGVHLTAGRLP